MTDTQLETILHNLNKKGERELIFLTPLSPLVEYGKVWAAKPSGQLAGYIPEKIYCIKNQEGVYVAAVIDTIDNLHWLVLKEHRRQAHLPLALKDIILPHLFQYKKSQRLIISKHLIKEPFFTAAEKIAVRAGFTATSPTADASAFVIHFTGTTDKNFKEPGNTQIPKQRVVELKKQINFISQSLLLVQTEIEIKRGVSKYSEKLKNLCNEIYSNMDRLDHVCIDDDRP